MNFPRGLGLLPVLIVVGAVCIGVRFGQFIGGDATRQMSVAMKSAEALAQTEPSAGPPSDAGLSKVDEPKTDAKAPEEGAAGKPEVETPSLGAPLNERSWKDSSQSDFEESEVKMELFEDLTKRRREMDAREKELVLREALVKAGEQEIDQKYKEMESIRADIQSLLKQQTAEEDKRITSLVKIYEGMKAKDAARIFDTLDMDVLLAVMTKMSERKTAPVLAAMDPEKARRVTILMAEQHKLPELPELPLSQ